MKILLVSHAVWTSHLGAVKVHIDLKAQYEKMGHTVDTFSLSNMYPNGETPFSKVFGKTYPEIIFRYLKENASKYDVIDANITCVIYPKEKFHYKGILLCRSHGIDPIYKNAEETIPGYRDAILRNKSKSVKTFFGNIYRAMQKKVGEREFLQSIQVADLVHCLNSHEYNYFKSIGINENKLMIIPNGIDNEFINKANVISLSTNNRGLVFIGSWTVRKGILDLNEILKNVEPSLWDTIYLLGGLTNKEKVEQYFDVEIRKKIEIISSFDKNDLLAILKKCKCGLFPSYIEGFGLAVVEQLASGIPVVAYDTPGPEDILSQYKELLLVEPGNKAEFSRKMTTILKFNEQQFQSLSKNCKKVSHKYRLSDVANIFINKFQEMQNLVNI